MGLRDSPLVKVTSPSFSRHPALREELLSLFPQACFNDSGGHLTEPGLAAWLADADAAVIGLEAVTGALLDGCSRLTMVAKYGVGLDNIDQDACRARNVAVGWTGGVNRRSVAELVLAYMLGLARNVFVTDRLMRAGVWQKNGGVQLSGKTVGIIGLGNIGKEVVALLAPFGCRILANDIADIGEYCRSRGVEAVDKDTLYRESDFVTLHVPLTELTRGMIDADALARWQPGSVLINTARGGIVVEADLCAALEDGPLGAAALDVYEHEPPTDARLLGRPNIVCTPHIGGNADEAVLAMGRSAIGHLRRHFSGAIG